MNKLHLTATGYPGTTKSWTFTQQILIDTFGAVAKAIGENVIITGVEEDNGQLSDGFIIYNGEIYRFATSAVNPTVSIIEEVELVSYNTDINNDTVLDELPAYKTRYAICGDGLPNTIATFDFADLTSIKTLLELSQIEAATQQEVNADEATKFVTGATLNGRTATTARRGVLALATAAEVLLGTDNTKAITPNALKLAGIVPLKITYGRIMTTYLLNGQQQSNFDKNKGYVYPPAGYNMTHLRGFMASISEIYFNGDVNNDDTLWCNYEEQANRIAVTCNNSEHRHNSKFNYIAIWHK